MAADVGERCERRARREYGGSGSGSASVPLRVALAVRARAPACAPSRAEPARLRGSRAVSARMCAPRARPTPRAPGRPLGGRLRARAPGPRSARVRGAPRSRRPGPRCGARATAARRPARPRNAARCAPEVFLAAVPSAGAGCAPASEKPAGEERGKRGRRGGKLALDLLPLVFFF